MESPSFHRNILALIAGGTIILTAAVVGCTMDALDSNETEREKVAACQVSESVLECLEEIDGE